MKLTGKLTFEYIAVKPITIEKDEQNGSGIILPSGVKAKDAGDNLTDYPDHIAQGIVVDVADAVTICKPGDTVLLMLASDYMARPSFLNDKGTMYHLYRQSDVVLVREKDGTA